MSGNEEDPGANTQMFRAFVEERNVEGAGKPNPRTGLIAVLVALAVVILAAVVAYALLR